MEKFYPIHSTQELEEYLVGYSQLIKFSLDQYGIDLHYYECLGDHLGMQVLSSEEFDVCHEIITSYSQMVHDSIIHNRRNRVYQFNNEFDFLGVTMPRIEIFEPKPNADKSKLRPGIEHVAFASMVKYDLLHEDCIHKRVPIDKSQHIENSKFFKTVFLNGVELEFRNNELGI